MRVKQEGPRDQRTIEGGSNERDELKDTRIEKRAAQPDGEASKSEPEAEPAPLNSS